MSRGAILYDFLQVRGGAEGVALTLARAWPGVDLCVGFRDPGAFPDNEIVELNCIDLHSRAGSAPWQALKTLQAFATKTRFLSRYDWVVYSGSYAPVAVHNHPQGRNILYCHTIPRFAYDLREYYLRRCALWQRPILRALAAYVRRCYEAAIANMEVIVANSDNVRRRLKRHLGREAVVIYPPCRVDAFRWLGQDDYYLSLARLEPLKRVGLIVEAFHRMPERRLVVASGGSELPRLQQIAAGADNIRFTGWLDELRLRELIGRSVATLYLPRDEDFGLSPVESMAAGKPVIGVAEGGLLETVVDSETGLLLPPNSRPEDVIEAVRAITPRRALAMRDACEARARLFTRELFLDKMRRLF